MLFVCPLERHPAAVYMLCTRGQSLGTHTGIQRLNIPPRARSQIGHIKQGNDVSARPSVNAAPHFSPRGVLAALARSNPDSSRDKVRAKPRSAGAPSPSSAGCRHRSRPPDGLRLPRAGAETRGKGSPRLGKRLARPAG